MKQIIIDCDPGIDDALALFLAAGSSELDIIAVTTVAGNRPVRTTCQNAGRILRIAGRHEVPVYAGAAIPLGQASARCNLVHGADGLGGVDLGPAPPPAEGHAANRLVEMLLARPAHSVTLVATGPLTNLALAESLSPGILARASQLVIMGGALRCPGNITPSAEFNFHADPIAAQVVLASGAPVVLFPLDVTGAAIMPDEWIASFASLDSDCGRATCDMLTAYAKFDPLLHDACPVAWLLAPELFQGAPCRIDVDWRSGPTEGYCIARFGGENMNATAMHGVELAALLALVRERIGTLP